MRKRSAPFIYVMCIAATLNAQMLVHTSQRIPGQAPTQPTTVTAASTSEFLNSIGVACHLNYTWTPYEDFQTTKALLVASGIRNIRDGGADPLAITRLRDRESSRHPSDLGDGFHRRGCANPGLLDGGAAPDHDSFPQGCSGGNRKPNDIVEVSNEIDIFYANKHWRAHDSSPSLR